MPINRLLAKTQAEKDLEATIRGRPAATDTAIAGTRAATEASRGRFSEFTQGLAGSLGQPGTGIDLAARPSLDRIGEDLRRTQDEELAQRKLQESRQGMSDTFNFLSKRLQAAGIDRTTAEGVAQQFALDEQARKAASSENEAARKTATKKQDLLDMYANRQIEIEQAVARERQKDAIKSALWRTFFGMSGVFAGWGIASAAGAGATATTASTLAGGQVRNIVGSGATLREKSGFTPR